MFYIYDIRCTNKSCLDEAESQSSTGKQPKKQRKYKSKEPVGTHPEQSERGKESNETGNRKYRLYNRDCAATLNMLKIWKSVRQCGKVPSVFKRGQAKSSRKRSAPMDNQEHQEKGKQRKVESTGDPNFDFF